MRIGLCLPGGGAKGAYEAGVICGLYDKGIKEFAAISGTSIGAFNGYYVFTDNVSKLRELWTNIKTNFNNSIKFIDKTVDNTELINKLTELNYNHENNKNDSYFYVNYLNINNKKINEVIVDISMKNKEEVFKAIKYSSLLPINLETKDETKTLKENFLRDVQNGLYDGYSLDGGMKNNVLLAPLLEARLDKIIIVALRNDYIIPELIKVQYPIKDIIVIRPTTTFKPNDTLNFTEEFCTKIFEEGYNIALNTNI